MKVKVKVKAKVKAKAKARATHLGKKALAVVLVDRAGAELRDLHHEVIVEVLRLLRLEEELVMKVNGDEIGIR